jgi:hypothetical protein
MAERLKQQHHLLALKTSLGREGRTWLVQFELESHIGTTPSTLTSMRLPTEALGLPRYFEPDTAPTFHLPLSITKELATRIEQLDLEPSHPLWLHLVKPYGYLGMVPWEDLLVPVISRPVLRLPDFLEPARERRDTLDVAICCSVPLSEPSFSIADILGRVAAAILSNAPRPRTQLHVFPDIDSFGALRSTFANESRVAVHDPSGAMRYDQADSSSGSPDLVRTVTSPWLQWMRDAMQGRSLDTVHFVCHGYFSEERASLTVAESPASNQNRRTARFLGVSETAAFLNQTGAWSVVCTAPPNNYSDAGLRYFVDTLAQVRPGPALFHDAGRDPSFQALGEAYGFLFSPKPMEAVAGPIFMYCQPALVDTQLPMPAPEPYATAMVSLNEELFSSPAAAEPVPNWVASAQRYVEEQAQEAQRRDASSARSPGSRAQNSPSLVAATLTDVQNIIRVFAQSTSLRSKS